MYFNTLLYSNIKEEDNAFMLALKCEESKGINISHGNLLFNIDAEVLQFGYQTGLETLVVHTLNDEY